LSSARCGPQRVGPALLHKAAIGVPYLGTEQRVIDPAFGGINIEIRRHDVVIAGEHDRLPGREQAPSMVRQPVEPAQLVIELRPRRGIAVRQVACGSRGFPARRDAFRRVRAPFPDAVTGLSALRDNPEVSVGWCDPTAPMSTMHDLIETGLS
jgi:hypothetical protein